MHLVMFDIDGTLTETMKVDEECFVRSFKDVFGVTDGYIPEARVVGNQRNSRPIRKPHRHWSRTLHSMLRPGQRRCRTRRCKRPRQ